MKDIGLPVMPFLWWVFFFYILFSTFYSLVWRVLHSIFSIFIAMSYCLSYPGFFHSRSRLIGCCLLCSAHSRPILIGCCLLHSAHSRPRLIGCYRLSFAHLGPRFIGYYMLYCDVQSQGLLTVICCTFAIQGQGLLTVICCILPLLAKIHGLLIIAFCRL